MKIIYPSPDGQVDPQLLVVNSVLIISNGPKY